MKKRKIEDEIDFIGGGRPVTDEDKRAISEFIQANKLKTKRRAARKKKAPAHKN